MAKQTYFDQTWLTCDRYSKYHSWLGACDDRTSFRCHVCLKTLKLSNMGIEAIKSHSENQKHLRLVAQQSAGVTPSVVSFFKSSKSSRQVLSPETESTVQQIQPVAIPAVSGSNENATSGSLSKAPAAANTPATFWSSDEQRIRAEIYWVLHMIDSHCSFNSAAGMSDLFRLMFPDSSIAEQFKMGDDKTRYVTVYGLAPHFIQKLADSVKEKDYVLLFDEALNKKAQQKQLDIHLRFWNGTEVATRYYTSVFMGHASASELIQEIDTSVVKLSKMRIVQIGMDGPNVNWKLFEDLQKELQSETGKQMLNVGSCGLHTVHGAYRDGIKATKWDTECFLSSCYYLFKDTPARREDFTKLTSCSTFPLKFVPHRWVENVPVIARVLDVLPALRQYKKAVDEKKLKNPDTKSFKHVADGCADPLLEVKLHFMLSVAKIMQAFLQRFQTDKPMLPFLVSDEVNLVQDLLARFIDRKKLDTLKTTADVCKFNVEKSENHKQVDMGFSAEKLIRKQASMKTKQFSDKDVFGVRQDGKSMLIAVCKKMLTKTPMTYVTARNLMCLDPRLMASDPETCGTMMRRLLSTCVDAKLVDADTCDDVLSDFSNFMRTTPHGDLESYDVTNDRIDAFLHQRMFICHKKAWPVVQKLLVLSHGQATVERGFSVNKELVVENQQLQSLVARRIIKDHINFVKGVDKVHISHSMIVSVRGARARYMNDLTMKREKQEQDKKAQKRKAEEDKLSDMQNDCKRLKTDIEQLTANSKKMYDKSESTRSVSFVTQGNALRRSAEEKQKEVDKLLKDIDAQQLVIKQM